MPTSGLDFDNFPDDAKRRINAPPSMIYHGVRTESAVLMGMNSVPRTVEESLGARFETAGLPEEQNVRSAREVQKSLTDTEWTTAKPPDTPMSGADQRFLAKR